MNNIIGIDIGGTHFRIGLVDAEGNVTNFQKLPTRQVLHSENVLNDIAEFIKSYASDYDSVAIGFPATLNISRTKILQALLLAYSSSFLSVKVW